MPDGPKTAGESACPTIAEAMLRWLVGGRDADAVSGDLREAFAARGGGRLWYWGQALSCIAVRLSPHRRMLPGLGKDFQYALRTLRRNAGYALTAMLCLALAMGVNATLFSFLDSMYFRKLPVPDAGRMVLIHREGDDKFCAWRDFGSVHDSVRSLEPAAQTTFFDSLDIERTGHNATVMMVSSNYAKVLRLGVGLGRWFAPADTLSAAAEPVAVVSDRLWKTRLNSDPNVLGRQIRTLHRTFTIIGVAPPGFRGTLPPLAVDTWVPANNIRSATSGFMVDLIGRLSPGASPDSAMAEMRVIDARLRAADPGNPRLHGHVRIEPASGFRMNSRESFRSTLWLMSAVSGAVLLIACVNVASLLLSRAAVRRHEMAVRQSLGASRARLFRATLAEGLVLAAGGTVLGVFAGYWTGRGIELLMPFLPQAGYQGIGLGVDWRVALIAGAMGFASAIFFSLPPAFANSRDLYAGLRGSEGVRLSRQREFYSLAQVALSLTLLVAMGLMLRALQRVQNIDPKFATDHRLYVDLFAAQKGGKPEAVTQLFTGLLDQARALPGVLDATLAWEVFPDAGAACASPSPQEPPRDMRSNTVEPNYFETMRVPLVSGRGFGMTSAPGSPADVVVNETMARAWWPGQEAIGKRVWLGCEGNPREMAQVVGIARDSKYESLSEDAKPFYYLSRRQAAGNGYFSLIVRTAGDPYGWAKPLLSLVRENPDFTVYEVKTLEDAVAASLWEIKWQAGLLASLGLASLGLLAIVLAAMGLYGVVAYAVSQRTREIGVRMALGAAPGDVQWMVLAHGLRIIGLGILGGLLLSAATVRLLRSFLYGLSPYDPAAFGAASIAWLMVAMLASWYPARRATRVDPLTALKYE
jgi:predicted permease